MLNNKDEGEVNQNEEDDMQQNNYEGNRSASLAEKYKNDEDK